MEFLRDIWYMAGWDDEISQKPILRKIADEPIVLYRTDDGGVVALADTCPHRFAPLNLGTVVEDTIQCPYHGLRFDASGACVHNPHGDGRIPAAARVKSYPVVERDTIIWLWIGDAARQDPSRIKDYSILNQHDRFTYTFGGTLTMNTRYDLIIDNLMDLSHAAYLHLKTLGTEAVVRGHTKVYTDGTTVHSNRMCPNGLPIPLMPLAGACKPDDYVDFWADIEWSPPANLYLETGIVPAGQPRDDKAKLMPSVQILTPQSENVTTYFIKLFWNFNREAPMREMILDGIMTAFKTEDEMMIQQVDERMDGRDFWSMKPILLQSDSGAVQTRRMMEKLLQRQQQSTAA